MKVHILMLTLPILLSSALPAVSKSSIGHNDGPWNADHIDDLPSEVRHYIAGICRGPATAQHDFATYSHREKRWRINLEYLRCNGIGAFRRGNQCLDVDFVEQGSRFHLGEKQFRDCGF
ncbi:hypothetical protein BraRD5C2_01640 [Bradyrhizobium sp. RD5-C2]|nr:hypothetical protein BraRD5C2_01640 [Bradyrhizobium sp. RD5-C2]